MKQSKSKLPWKINANGCLESENVDILSGDDFGYAWFNNNEDGDYCVQACNNFPEAIKLLNRLKTAYSTNCKESNEDGSISGWGLLVEIEEFLKSLENER